MNMVRFLQSLLFVSAIAGLSFIASTAHAQSTGPSPLATPNATNPSATGVSATPTPSAGDGTATIGSVLPQSDSITGTESVATEADDETEPLPTVVLSGTPTADLNVPMTVTVESESGPLEGTILTNRSEVVARFFVEGQTYQLTAGRSQGLQLPRATTVLNLFNCDGEMAVDTPGCFWDPYLIQLDGFYEIYDAATDAESEAGEVTLLLRAAGTPPTGQVWVQNRTGQTESVVFRDEVHEILPTAVLELPVAAGVPAILYVRSCLTVDNQSACEWAPRTLDAGVYYAMLEVDAPSSQSGSTMTTIDLRPVVGEGEESAAAAISTQAPSIMCSVVVPALNIRSGPGLQYDIIGKVRTTDGSSGTVDVVGRSADNEWLTVDPESAEGGWINNSPSFITCSSDVMSLPVVEAPPPPTPQPVIVAPAAPSNETTGVPQDAQIAQPPATETPSPSATGAVTPTASAPVVPAGQGLLVINNGFQHVVRFTLDQLYRPIEGPSEYDLQPGESISIAVFPGDIAFSASTPWSGLAGNASVHVEADQSLTLWLRFEPEPGGNWALRWN
jgi:hypothetical protein